MSTSSPGQRPNSPGTVTLHCAYCNSGSVVPDDATFFNCRSCRHQNTIFLCAHCDTVSISASPEVAAPSQWTCQACGGQTQIPRFGRMPVVSASTAAAAAAETSRGPTPGTSAPSLAGFIVVASSHLAIPEGTNCTVTVLEDAVDVRMSDGQSGHRFPFTDLTRFDVGGRTAPRRGRDGSLSLRRGPQPSKGEAILRIATAQDTVVLNHPSHSRRHLSVVFGDAVARWESGQPQARAQEPSAMSFEDALNEFERLIVARERGQIADVEYATLRGVIVKRLSSRGGDRRRFPHRY